MTTGSIIAQTIERATVTLGRTPGTRFTQADLGRAGLTRWHRRRYILIQRCRFRGGAAAGRKRGDTYDAYPRALREGQNIARAHRLV